MHNGMHMQLLHCANPGALTVITAKFIMHTWYTIVFCRYEYFANELQCITREELAVL